MRYLKRTYTCKFKRRHEATGRSSSSDGPLIFRKVTSTTTTFLFNYRYA